MAALVVAGLLVGVTMLAGCTATHQAQGQAGSHGGVAGGGQQSAAEPVLALGTENHRASERVVAAGGADAPYNYGPTVMRDGDRTRMWWCSQYGSAPPPGDDILYATTTSLTKKFTGPGGKMPPAVLSGRPGGFDGMHTCDPSVIKVDGQHYLYYTGAKGDHSFGNAIGLATSEDGVNWTRANGGKPIVKPARDTARDNSYGAGQPAVVFLDGWFYLMFTDTTGRSAGWNGAGQFLLRSTDPTFGSGVEALGRTGFMPVPHTAMPRETSLVDAFSVDLMWVAALDAWAIAHQTEDGTTLTFWNREFTGSPHHPLVVPGLWAEGPGLVRTPLGHAPISADDPCGTVPVDVIRATVKPDAPTDLRHFGIDVRGALGCAEPTRALRVLDGYTMPSPERTMDLVVQGKLVRVERRSVAIRLAERVLEHRPAALVRLPVDARLAAGAPLVHSPNSGSGLLLDDGRLWPVYAEGIAELNGSKARTISDARWRGYPVGSVLG
ncbi:MAG: beta-xylosidase [Haloechinothrix sp.]